MTKLATAAALLSLICSILVTEQAQAFCPKCVKIEQERASHPQQDAGYYDEGTNKTQIQKSDEMPSQNNVNTTPKADKMKAKN